MVRFWTCQRQTAGVRCGTRNPAVKRNCMGCGKPRPNRKRPAHKAALDLPYSVFLEANDGVELCGICGRAPKPGRRLDRDHAHVGAGWPRGLLCHLCNRRLGPEVTVEWLEAALAYLERARERSVIMANTQPEGGREHDGS